MRAVLMWLLSGASKCIVMFNVQCSNYDNVQCSNYEKMPTRICIISCGYSGGQVRLLWSNNQNMQIWGTHNQERKNIDQLTILMICEPDLNLFRRWLLVQDTFLMYVNTDTGESFLWIISRGYLAFNYFEKISYTD